MQLIDDERRSVSPDTIDASSEPAEQVDDLEDLRKKFVGELDLPESTYPGFHVHILHANQCT